MLRSIALRLMSSYLVIIVIISALFSYMGIRVIDNRVVAEAQHRVAESLNAGREIYNNELRTVQQSVRVSGERLFLRDAIASGRPGRIVSLLADVRQPRMGAARGPDADGERPGRPVPRHLHADAPVGRAHMRGREPVRDGGRDRGDPRRATGHPDRPAVLAGLGRGRVGGHLGVTVGPSVHRHVETQAGVLSGGTEQLPTG